MRKVRYNTNQKSNRKKNILLGISAVTLLVAVFFLSFIIAYNLMAKNQRIDPDQEPSMTISQENGQEDLSEVERLQEEIKALNEQIDELNAEVEKYKAIAQMRSGSIPAATAPPPTRSPEQTPSRPSPTPSSAPQSTKTPTPTPTPTPEQTDDTPQQSSTPTPPPVSTPTPPPVSTQTPPPADDDGNLDGI